MGGLLKRAVAADAPATNKEDPESWHKTGTGALFGRPSSEHQVRKLDGTKPCDLENASKRVGN